MFKNIVCDASTICGAVNENKRLLFYVYCYVVSYFLALVQIQFSQSLHVFSTECLNLLWLLRQPTIVGMEIIVIING